MCGKDMSFKHEKLAAKGSPPHVRERPRRGHPFFDDVGITPACAGKTQSQWQRGLPGRDHPRMCGKD